MKKLSPEALQRVYLLARNARWRYQLDQYEDEAIKSILGTLRKTIEEIETRVADTELTDWQARRSEELLVELDSLLAGARMQLTNDINDVASHAGEWAAVSYSDITSFGGIVEGFNNVALSAGQFRQFFQDTPLGGKLLNEWVDTAFDSTIVAQMKENLNIGVLQGEGYRKLYKRVLGEGMVDLEREAITLTRTYVQSANVAAQEAVYEANDDIVTGVEWTATLEPGYKSTGRGTCLRCAALDGQKWKNGEERPDCPLHPRCRCDLIPTLKTWRELGLDIDEMEEVARPYTMRQDKNIDAGGTRAIEEQGFHDGDYGSWFAKQGQDFKLKAVGTRRLMLLESGEVRFHELVDRKTGALRTLEDLGWSKDKYAPVTGTGGASADDKQFLERLTKKIGPLSIGPHTPKGVHTVRTVKTSDYFMATDSKGRISISTHTWTNSAGFNPFVDLKNGVRKLAEGEQISFNEEYAMESFWHEANHNRQQWDGIHRPSPAHHSVVTMETMNQWYSRRSYQQAVQVLTGQQPQHQKHVLTDGYGYRSWVQRFDALLAKLELSGEDIFPDVEKMVLETNRYEYGEQLATVLAWKSGKEADKIREILKRLDDGNFFKKTVKKL